MDPILGLTVIGTVGLLVLVWRALHRTSRLEIGDRGILDRSLGLGWIRWEEIEGAYQRRSLEEQSVFLRLRPTERIRRRLARAPEQPFDVRLDLSGTGLSPVEVVQEILAHGRR
jgi:hypothetical protein